MTAKVSKKEVVNFLVVMLIFIAGMIAMIYYKIENIWIWIGYISVWTWLEALVAKNFHLKWWVWGLIIAALCGVDYIIIHLLSN
jgi:hypothetical protein